MSATSSSQASENSLSNNNLSSSHPPTPVEECSAKKYRGKEGKELPRRRIGLGKRLKHLLHFGKIKKFCIMIHCWTILTKIKSRLLFNKSQSSWRQMKKMSAKKMASLRSCYCQLKNQYKSAKKKSGSGTTDIKKPTWPFFDSLKVLDDNLTVKGASSSINLSEVSQFKKKRKEVNSSEVEEWMKNQNSLVSKLIQSYDEPKEWTFVTKDELFGQLIAKYIAKIPDGEIKEEPMIEIQQCILNAKRHAPKS